MPFQSAPKCVEAVINFTIGSKPAANVIVCAFPSGYSQSDVDNLAQDVDDWVGAEYLPLIAGAVTYNGVHTRGLENIIDLEADNNVHAGSGGASGDSMPANTSLCVTLRTGLTGRSARGRFYTMPTSEINSLGSQAYTSAYGVAQAGSMAALKTLLNGGGRVWVVLSRYSLGARRPLAIYTPITNAEVRNTLLDSQRGRLANGH